MRTSLPTLNFGVDLLLSDVKGANFHLANAKASEMTERVKQVDSDVFVRSSIVYTHTPVYLASRSLNAFGRQFSPF